MSKIEELIQQLCPNGVEWKEIGEICKIQRGVRVVRNDLSTEGQYPVYQNSLIPLGYYTNTNYPKNTTYIIGAGAAADIGFSEIPYWGADDCYSVLCSKTILNKFVYYYLKNNQLYLKTRVRKASIPRLARNVIEKMIIPLPPLPVQEEIVRILDAFSNHAAELQAELQARREQYEYYRNKLLSFENDSSVEWKFIGDVIDVSRGASPRPISNYITDSSQGIPWIKIGDVDPRSKFVTQTAQRITSEGSKKSKYLKAGDFILSNSMSFGRPYILKIDGCIHDGWISMSKFEDNLLPDYLYHILRTNNIQRYWAKSAGTGAVSNLNADIVRKTLIPIPPISEQRRIVAILDKFEALVNDLTEGLPAEIAARQEQYEYYRDRLLSFPKAV